MATEVHVVEGSVVGRVELDAVAARYTLTEDGATGILAFTVDGTRLVIEHVAVPDAIAGRGVGGALVATAVARANDEHLTVVPRCPFARHWLKTNPDTAATTDIDWSGQR